MFNILIILSLISSVLSRKYYINNEVRYFSFIPSNETNIFYTKGKGGQQITFTLTMENMNKKPFDFWYSDEWLDYYDNATFRKTVDVTETHNKIYYDGYVSLGNYIDFNFTSNYDLKNVKINIMVYGKSQEEKDAEFLKGIQIFLIVVLIIVVFTPITIAVICIIVIGTQCTKRRPPPQFQNNNPYQQQDLPQQPQYYSPPQQQYYPPPQPQILVQPQNPPIQASTQ